MPFSFLFARPFLWGGLAAAVLVADHYGQIDRALALYKGTQTAQPLQTRAQYEADLIFAQTQAEKFLPRFLAQSFHPANSWETRAVLVSFASGETKEELWVEGFAPAESTKLTGRLSQPSAVLSDLAAGEDVTFDLADIVDWSFVKEGRGYGYFTIHAGLPYMPTSQAEVTRDFLHERPLPSGW